MRDLVRKSLVLLGNFKEVFQYGYLNWHAFRRIPRKLENYHAQSKEKFKAINVLDTHFIHEVQSLKKIDTLRQFVVTLWPVCVGDPPLDATLSLHLRSYEIPDARSCPV